MIFYSVQMYSLERDQPPQDSPIHLQSVVAFAVLELTRSNQGKCQAGKTRKENPSLESDCLGNTTGMIGSPFDPLQIPFSPTLGLSDISVIKGLL